MMRYINIFLLPFSKAKNNPTYYGFTLIFVKLDVFKSMLSDILGVRADKL